MTERSTVAEPRRRRSADTASDEPASDEPCAFDPPGNAERYTERDELGRGGMGRVAEAFDVALGRAVAIKHMLSSEHDSLARFEREARITARLEHPSIVPLYDAGRNPDGTPFYVMRKVDGERLDKLLAAKPAQALALVPNILAACDAIAFAHARGIVHRDLKPPNILVGAFGETLVIDWGLARHVEDSDNDAAAAEHKLDGITRVGSVAGTPGFMAPEQARGEAIDPRVDVFALGATLFFVLARRPPFDTAKDATQMVEWAAENRAPEWDELGDDVPPDLEAIARKAMASDPGERYVDAGALAADLRRFVTGNLVAAHRYAVAERVRRFVRRHRAAVAIGAVALVAIAAIGIISIRRVLAERDAARTARIAETTAKTAAQAQADRELLARAATLLATDPLRAVTALRELRSGSPAWRSAAGLLELARWRGVPFGFREPGVTHFAFAPNSHRAFAIDTAKQLVLYDLDRRSQTVLRTDLAGTAATWRDADHIAVFEPGRVRIFDLRGLVTDTIEAPRDAFVRWSESGQIWYRRNGVVYVLVGRAWQMVFDRADEAEPDFALARWVIRRGPQLVLRHGMTETPLGTMTDGMLIVSWAADSVAIAHDNAIDQFAFDGTKRMTWPARFVTELAISADHPFAVSEGRLVELASGEAAPAVARTRQLFESRHGTIVTGATGELVLHDGHPFTFDPGVVRPTNLWWSDDGALLVIAAEAGLTVFDLGTFRPRTFTFAEDRLVSRVDATYAWSWSPGQLYRRALATGVETPAAVGMSGPITSGDGRFFAIGMGSTVELYDGLTRVGALASPLVTPTATGLVATDGTVLRRFAPSAPTGEPLATLPFVPTLLASSERSVLAATRDATVRLDLDTKLVTPLAITELQDATFDAAGRLYVVAGGRLLDGTTFAPLEVPACDQFVVDLARCGGALYVLGDDVHAIASDVREWTADGELAIFRTGGGELRILDRASGFAIPIARPPEHLPLVADHRVVSLDGRTLQIQTFAPATSEAEFRDRLARMTNAVVIAGGVVWP